MGGLCPKVAETENDSLRRPLNPNEKRGIRKEQMPLLEMDMAAPEEPPQRSPDRGVFSQQQQAE